jgi:hypothetical protein
VGASPALEARSGVVCANNDPVHGREALQTCPSRDPGRVKESSPGSKTRGFMAPAFLTTLKGSQTLTVKSAEGNATPPRTIEFIESQRLSNRFNSDFF